MKRRHTLLIALLQVVSCGLASGIPLDGVRIIGWQVFSDNINFDGVINAGENVRYGIIVENGTGVTRDIYAVPSNDSLDEYDFIGVTPWNTFQQIHTHIFISTLLQNPLR